MRSIRSIWIFVCVGQLAINSRFVDKFQLEIISFGVVYTELKHFCGCDLPEMRIVRGSIDIVVVLLPMSTSWTPILARVRS